MTEVDCNWLECTGKVALGATPPDYAWATVIQKPFPHREETAFGPFCRTCEARLLSMLRTLTKPPATPGDT